MLYTTRIEFTLAFPQAKMDVTIYMEVSLGYKVPEGDYVCLLLKNIYGLRQLARTWFEYMQDSLIESEENGGFRFKQSLIDSCIFYKEDISLISWVDDCLIFTKNKELADNLIKGFQEKFVLGNKHVYR